LHISLDLARILTRFGTILTRFWVKIEYLVGLEGKVLDIQEPFITPFIVDLPIKNGDFP